MRNRDFRYFSIAKEVSQLSKMGKIKIGAVIVKKHHIIGEGTNTKNSRGEVTAPVRIRIA